MKSMQKITTTEAAQVLQKYNKIALFAHTRPDGDTIGACVATATILKKLGKDVRVFCDCALEGAFPKFAETSIIERNFDGKYDLMVAIDCGDIFRLGEFSGIFDSFNNTMVIDHHGGEMFAKNNCLFPYASCCQIIYEINKCLGVELDKTIATYLYMGLCTDTGNFAHSNTDKPSFLMAAELCECGAEMEKVNRLFFKEMTFEEEKLIAKVLSRARRYFDGKLVIVYTMQSDLAELGLPFSASEGMVPYAINVDTALIGVSLSEYAENTYKVSMRGKNFNVRDICREFGGNGHLVAAGCMISGLFEDVVERIVKAVEERL